MFQKLSSRRRPSRAAVLFWGTLAVLWALGLGHFLGRPFWFW